jgi:dipeptidyl aminopeptidase/acylaminoacyl peptidase
MGNTRTFVFCITMLCLVAATATGAERTHDIVPEDYFGLATVGAVAVSPDGALVAYVETRWGDERRSSDLWIASTTGAEPPRRATFDGFRPSSLTWSRDSRVLYFAGADPHPRGETPPFDGSTQVWRVGPNTLEPSPVTRVDGGIAHFVMAPDGRSLLYTTTDEVVDDEWKDLKTEFADLEYGHGVGDRHAIHRLDLQSWRSHDIRAAEWVIHDLALSPDGEHLALLITDDDELIVYEGRSRVEILDLESGTTVNATPAAWRDDHPSPFGWIQHPVWSPDGEAVAFTIAFDGYPTEIWVAEDATGDQPELSRIDRVDEVHVGGSMHWVGPERRLRFVADDRARARLYEVDGVRDGAQGATRTLTPGDIVVHTAASSADGATAVAMIASPTATGDLYRITKGGEPFRLTTLNPQVDTWRLPQIEVVRWKGADGDTVEGILELPPDYSPDHGPLPMLVELHGGPTSATRYQLRLWTYGRALMASKGYALLSPNYHGSTGYGDDFMTALIGRENDIEIIDIRTGVEAMVERGVADPERLGVLGWSNGGFLTNAMITAEPDLFRAASSGAGVLHQVLQWSIQDTPGHNINFMQGLPWDVPDAFRAGSPLYRLGAVKTPTLIHVGGADPRVPPAHSRALYRALRHYLGVPVELVVYPGEGHGLAKRANRLAKMRWDLAWFDHYLKGNPE